MRIILADNDQRAFSALRMLLKCEPGLEVVGEAMTTAELVALAQDGALDLILIDWELNGQPDAALLSALRDLQPKALIIALSGRPESEQEALHAGADAFVSKAKPASALISEVFGLGNGDRAAK